MAGSWSRATYTDKYRTCGPLIDQQWEEREAALNEGRAGRVHAAHANGAVQRREREGERERERGGEGEGEREL